MFKNWDSDSKFLLFVAVMAAISLLVTYRTGIAKTAERVVQAIEEKVSHFAPDSPSHDSAGHVEDDNVARNAAEYGSRCRRVGRNCGRSCRIIIVDNGGHRWLAYPRCSVHRCDP
jgi:hypothetical protein